MVVSKCICVCTWHKCLTLMHEKQVTKLEGELASFSLSEKNRAALEGSLKVEETAEIEMELLAREMREMGFDSTDIDAVTGTTAPDA